MNHRKYREWLDLSSYDELSDTERVELERHLTGCRDCREYGEDVKKLHAAVARHRRLGMSHQLLMDARRQLRRALDEDARPSPLWERIIEPIYRISFSGVAMLVVGFIVGYLTFSAPRIASMVKGEQTAVEEDARIMNVRFTDADASDGEIEFTYDAVRPGHMKGRIDDPQVQTVLAEALINEKNAGVRLRSVNALAEQTEPLESKELRQALLSAMTSDPNPAVRKEALGLVQKLPFDPEIKDAILYVLQHDDNAGVRIVAINSLDKFKDQVALKDNEVLKVLREQVQKDENNYIRLIARNFLEESKQQ